MLVPCRYLITRSMLVCSNVLYTPPHYRSLGFAVWNLEYRRIEGGGGWPATFLDIGAGVDHLRDLAVAHNLDLNRVIVTGHSAGGHLATWVAARPNIPKV